MQKTNSGGNELGELKNSEIMEWKRPEFRKTSMDNTYGKTIATPEGNANIQNQTAPS